MKKLLALILTAALLFCGCNSKLPKGVTQAVYDYGIKSLEVVDKYFEGTLSRTEAQKQMKELCTAYNKDKGTAKSEINISPSMEAISSYLMLEQDETNISSVNYTIYNERNDISYLLKLDSISEYPKTVQEQ